METLPIFKIPVWLIVKGFIIFALFLYLIFSFVVVKQVGLMIETLEVDYEQGVKLLAWLHFLFALAVLVFAIIIL